MKGAPVGIWILSFLLVILTIGTVLLKIYVLAIIMGLLTGAIIVLFWFESTQKIKLSPEDRPDKIPLKKGWFKWDIVFGAILSQLFLFSLILIAILVIFAPMDRYKPFEFYNMVFMVIKTISFIGVLKVYYKMNLSTLINDLRKYPSDSFWYYLFLRPHRRGMSPINPVKNKDLHVRRDVKIYYTLISAIIGLSAIEYIIWLII